jgi:hypothetical protein
MSEGKAIIIAAGISVGGMIITVLANIIFNFLKGKADMKERFFYEVYPKRLAVYEDVIKELQGMNIMDEEKIMRINGLEMSKIILANIHLLDILIARLFLYGSADSVTVLKELRIQLFHLHGKGLDCPLDNDTGKDVAIAFNSVLQIALNGFIIVVPEEMGANFVDKRIGKINKEFTRKKIDKKPSGDGNTQKKKHQGKRFFFNKQIQ